MRILTVGGGPAGLYASLLLKKADPAHDVIVLERNPPDATYGWGVVFSEETLGSLRDADRPSYDRIVESFASWTSIDVRYRDELVRSRGHAFTAIGRARLLDILQRRCAELGVELRFHHEADPAALPEADLVIAADGVNSRLRSSRSEVLRPTLDAHSTKFAWFGTDLAFPAFTFIFRQNEHGLFQVHAYPFDAHTSTFIVECPQATWRRAGLDGATEEESIAYCQRLFQDDLAGHRLLSNRSLWSSFVTVRTESWHDGNLVLVGDAAHTAHFTIGSGTKLAMEDAVALSEAIQRFPGDLRTGLVQYEMERQPAVERFQQAAGDSAAYFEHVRRYAGFDPVQFTFNLLTRSGRITHLELERRDPAFVALVDRRFDAWAREDEGSHRLVTPRPMLAPFDLGGTTLPNRVVMSPVGQDDATDGVPAGELGERLAGAARSGAGLVITEMVAVSAHGRFTPGTPGLYREDHAERWAGILDAVHRSGEARIGLRLGHAGARGSTMARRHGVDRPLRDGGWPLLAPSDVPFAPWAERPRPMTPDVMRDVAEDFVAAAERGRAAGFDLLVLDVSHGSLLASFLSPATNRRRDEFGGSLENRVRYVLEVAGGVRRVWPDDRPLGVRLTATDWLPGGFDLDDAVGVSQHLKGVGCRVIHPVGGRAVAEDRPEYRRFALLPASDRIRNEAGVATIASGGITTFDEIDTVVAAGRADLCVLDVWE